MLLLGKGLWGPLLQSRKTWRRKKYRSKCNSLETLFEVMISLSSSERLVGTCCTVVPHMLHQLSSRYFILRQIAKTVSSFARISSAFCSYDRVSI
ncbi:hypothetical protein KSF78_0002223 [Schistosoma japonicum]|nr:hypothetical protein KSF78_0002223 [Schistosoma japonicum]KAH8855962.1 hypothetical protein KSF78_0002223 [Schistosoma japonicum]KAH8855963.1 hypothetical protein KSF78_0002223 [Schistosoma japonicum]